MCRLLRTLELLLFIYRSKKIIRLAGRVSEYINGWICMVKQAFSWKTCFSPHAFVLIAKMIRSTILLFVALCGLSAVLAEPPQLRLTQSYLERAHRFAGNRFAGFNIFRRWIGFFFPFHEFILEIYFDREP